MRAVRFHRQGGVEVLQTEQAPAPPVAPHEVLIRVHACGVNRLDLKAREGRPEVEPIPHILGSDVAGEVVEIGSNVTTIAVGERIVVYPCIACGICEDCQLGDDPLCEHQKVFGFQTQGGYAEFVAAPASHVLPIPGTLAYQAAAALPVAYLTAWRMLSRARLRPGEDVLIHAAGSGVGSAAIQIARLCGARVFTTAGTDAKLERAAELGAEVLINYQREDFSQIVQKRTGGRGVDVVLEHVGAATWAASLDSLAKRGRLVTCGVTTGNRGELDIRRMYQKQWQIMGSALGNRAELRQVIKLAGEGKLAPVIDSVFPLQEAPQAHRRMEARQQFGKIILDCT